MPKLDTRQREKWPAPNPAPPRSEAETQVALAVEESKTNPMKAKARAVLALLRQEYGEPNWPVLDPLPSLVEILLSHRTTDPVAWTAFNELRRRFPTWEALRDAPVAEIGDAIHGTTWPEQKAPRIKAVLQKITEERGSLDLSFLFHVPLRRRTSGCKACLGWGRSRQLASCFSRATGRCCQWIYTCTA